MIFEKLNQKLVQLRLNNFLTIYYIKQIKIKIFFRFIE